MLLYLTWLMQIKIEIEIKSKICKMPNFTANRTIWYVVCVCVCVCVHARVYMGQGRVGDSIMLLKLLILYIFMNFVFKQNIDNSNKWRFKSSEIWWCIIVLAVPDVFKVSQSLKTLENTHSIILHHIPEDSGVLLFCEFPIIIWSGTLFCQFHSEAFILLCTSNWKFDSFLIHTVSVHSL